MSIELVNKIWFVEEKSLRGKLEDITTALGQLDFVAKEWTSLSVKGFKLSDRILEKEGPITTSELLEYTDNYKDQSVYFSAWSYMKCWRFQGAKASFEHIPIVLVFWDQKHIDFYESDYHLEGDANLLVDKTGPFTALVNKKETEEIKRVNEHVEKNLELIQQVLFQIAYLPSVKMIKSFSAEGLYQPMNAHLVYFNSTKALVNDLKFLKELWDSGMPAYKTPPMSESGKHLDKFTFHPWRNTDISVALYDSIKPLLETIEFSDEDDIPEIDWEKFDNFEHESGRIVLEYPHWVNYFVDRFYLELLQAFANKDKNLVE